MKTNIRKKVKKESFFNIISGVIIILSSSSLYGAGTKAGESLNITAGARSIAMGETGVAVSQDIEGMYYNPAAIARIKGDEAAFMYDKHFQDITYQNAGYVRKNDKIGNIGIDYKRFGINDIQGYDNSGDNTAKLSASDTQFQLSYGRKIYQPGPAAKEEGLYAGLNAKYIMENLAGQKSGTPAIDVGLQYNLSEMFSGIIRSRPTFGLSITNIAGSIGYDLKSAKLDMPVRFGVGLKGENKSLGLAMATDEDGIIISLGTEYTLMGMLSLRGGYTQKPKSIDKGLRAGVGLHISIFNIDYAYAGYGELGDTHKVGLTVKFGEGILMGEAAKSKSAMKEEYFTEGLELFNEERYAESILKFNKVLQIEPNHRQALEYMKRANERMK